MSVYDVVARLEDLLGNNALNVGGFHSQDTFGAGVVRIHADIHLLNAKILDEVLQVIRFYGVVDLENVLFRVRGPVEDEQQQYHMVRVIIRFRPHRLDWEW